MTPRRPRKSRRADAVAANKAFGGGRDARIRNVPKDVGCYVSDPFLRRKWEMGWEFQDRLSRS